VLRNLQFVIACCLVGSVANPQHVSHENLPQLLGYSHSRAPTPFILLAGSMGSIFIAPSLAD
jgi:hypothetical protein